MIHQIHIIVDDLHESTGSTNPGDARREFEGVRDPQGRELPYTEHEINGETHLIVTVPS